MQLVDLVGRWFHVSRKRKEKKKKKCACIVVIGMFKRYMPGSGCVMLE